MKLLQDYIFYSSFAHGIYMVKWVWMCAQCGARILRASKTGLIVGSITAKMAYQRKMRNPCWWLLYYEQFIQRLISCVIRKKYPSVLVNNICYMYSRTIYTDISCSEHLVSSGAARRTGSQKQTNKETKTKIQGVTLIFSLAVLRANSQLNQAPGSGYSDINSV